MKKTIRLIISIAIITIIILLYNTLMLSSKQVTSESLKKNSTPQ